MPTRQNTTDAAQSRRTSASNNNYSQKRTVEPPRKEQTPSRQRSRSSHSTSSSSSSSSDDSTSGSSSDTGSSNSSDSSSTSSDSGDKMAGGSDFGPRDSVAGTPSNLQQQNSYHQDDTRSPKHSSVVIDSRKISPSSPAKPDVEIVKTTSGENGRRDRIRIVLNGKQLLPVSSGQLCGVSESLRNISVYSDDEVDCNDDGRSLDRPHQQRIFAQVHQDASNKQSTESIQTGKYEVEVPQSKTDRVSTAEEADRAEIDDGKMSTTCSNSSVTLQDFRLNSANVDDRSRFSQRRRPSAEEWTGHISSLQTGKYEFPQSKYGGVSSAEEVDRTEIDHRKTKTFSNSWVTQDPQSANVDDRSRFSQRRRPSAEEWTWQASSLQTGRYEVTQSKNDRVSTAEEADRVDTDDGKMSTKCSNSSVTQDWRLNSANVDDRSRFSQRRRLSAEEWTGQAWSREERREHGYPGRRSRSPDTGYERGRPSLNERRSRRDANIVAADRGDSYYYRTVPERHPQYQSTRSGGGRRNKVSRSRSRSRDYSRSKSPCRLNRVDAEPAGVRSRTNVIEHRAAARTEPEERQRRWSRHDVTSASGRRSERRVSSRARPEVVETRRWREDRTRVAYGLEAQTVPTIPNVPSVQNVPIFPSVPTLPSIPTVPRGLLRPRRDQRYDWYNIDCA